MSPNVLKRLPDISYKDLKKVSNFFQKKGGYCSFYVPFTPCQRFFLRFAPATMYQRSDFVLLISRSKSMYRASVNDTPPIFSVPYFKTVQRIEEFLGPGSFLGNSSETWGYVRLGRQFFV